MKLVRLKITDPKGFRCLQAGFEVHFLREADQSDVDKYVYCNPYVLAGPNGSGKSNVLEALAAILYHVEAMYLKTRPDTFEYEDEQGNQQGFRSENALPDAFELEYLIRVPPEYNRKQASGFARVLITKFEGQWPMMQWLNREAFAEVGGTLFLSASEAKLFLPEFILGYSSGENEILSLPFFKMRFIHFDEYMDFLLRDDFYGQRPEGRLSYVDNSFSQAILLSNILMQKDEILTPVYDQIGIEALLEFRIIIKMSIEIDARDIDDYKKSE